MLLSGQKDLSRDSAHMGSRFRSNIPYARGLIDAAPLVDVVLLVLLFFVLHSSFVLQPGVALRLPETAHISGVPFGAMTVIVSQEDLVFFNDERIALKGLETAFQRAHHRDPDASLLIEADGRVPHRTLIDIYSMAMNAGIRDIAIAARYSTSERALP